MSLFVRPLLVLPSVGNINNPLPATGSYSAADTQSAACFVEFFPDGTIEIGFSVFPSLFFNWFTPTTPNIGDNYWIRFTLTSTTGTNNSGPNYTSWTLEPSTSGSTFWMNLNTSRQFNVYAFSVSSTMNRTATYTVEIATDPGGTNIVATGTPYTLTVQATPF